jgi:hypothetical protein
LHRGFLGWDMEEEILVIWDHIRYTISIIWHWTKPTPWTDLYQSTRVIISQLVNKMYSHCLFPVVDKSGTSCYHLVTRSMRPTDSQQVVPTSLISSARNKLMTTSS